MAQHRTDEILAILDERPATAFYWRLSLGDRQERSAAYQVLRRG